MEERGYRNKSGGRLKFLALTLVSIFTVTLAVVIGNRLSNEALAVLAGAVCGVGAAIPTSLLIVSVTRRRAEPRARTEPRNQGAYPPVVVVTPTGGQQQPYGWNGPPPSLNPPVSRQFTVVGEPSMDGETVGHERYF
jgi:hypothetical protein